MARCINVLSACVVLVMLLAAGCQGSRAGQRASGGATSSQTDQARVVEGEQGQTDNASTAVADLVAGMPSVANRRIQMEILLHAALYRAAHQSNVGDFTRHFLLEPVQETDAPDLGIDPDEFRLRVLAELADLGEPVAWLPETWRGRGVDYFPGTDQRATRLRIKITKRDEDQATVIGEVGDRTADVGSSRQGVTAIWDGVQWNLQRDPVRLVW